jgi:hypothetical protein
MYTFIVSPIQDAGLLISNLFVNLCECAFQVHNDGYVT